MPNTIRLWNPKAEQWEEFTPVETTGAIEHVGPIVTKTPLGMFVTQSIEIQEHDEDTPSGSAD